MTASNNLAGKLTRSKLAEGVSLANEGADLSAPSTFSYASVSDIHLGHTRTHAVDTIESLNHYITNPEYLATIDVLVIVGDLFDRGLRFSEDIIPTIERWAINTLLLCAKTDTDLWILEGTPSHDREQSKIFTHFNECLKIGCRLRYIDKVTIFFEPRFNAHFLFIPDGEADTDLTWRTVNELLTDHGIDQVDFGFIHGAFRYQLPEAANTPKHIEERYESVVRYIINVGHIHHASVRGKIHSNGSFDRTDHGYETPKGFWHVVYAEGTAKATFIKNERAKHYKTIDCRGIPLEEAMNKIQATMVEYGVEDSYFRVWAKDDDAILTHIGELKRKHKLFNWSSKNESVAAVQIGDQSIDDDRFVALTITPKTLPDILRKRMVSKNADATLFDEVLRIVEELNAA